MLKSMHMTKTVEAKIPTPFSMKLAEIHRLHHVLIEWNQRNSITSTQFSASATYLWKFNYFEVKIEISKIGRALLSLSESKVMSAAFVLWTREKYKNNSKARAPQIILAKTAQRLTFVLMRSRKGHSANRKKKLNQFYLFTLSSWDEIPGGNIISKASSLSLLPITSPIFTAREVPNKKESHQLFYVRLKAVWSIFILKITQSKEQGTLPKFIS